jgi:hypothetical protein
VVLPFQPLELRHRANSAGCGRVRSRNICFGHVPVAGRQGQRRDAAAIGEERHGRFAPGKRTYIRLHRYSGKFASRRCTFDELESLAVVFGGRLTTDACLCRCRLWQKNSAWASGGPAEGRRVAACLRRMARIAKRAARRDVKKPKPPCGLQIVQQDSNFRGLGCSRKGAARDQAVTEIRQICI